MDVFALVAAGDEAGLREALTGDPALAAARDDHAVSLTRWALYTGHRDLLATILAAAPPIDVFDAAALGDEERLRAVLLSDPDGATAHSGDGFTALYFAGFLGTSGCAEVLLRAGADPAARATGAMDVQPLHSAAAGRDADTVALLIEAGAPVDATQRGGFTALHEAALNGQERLVEVLLAAGADVTIANDDGKTAADLARDNGHAELAARLASA